MKEIEIIINNDGTAEINLNGYQGKGCAQITDEIIKALGAKIKTRSKKCEFHAAVDQQQKIKQRN